MAHVDVKWHGQDLLAKITGVSEQGMYEAAEEVLEAAKSIVPVRSGDLRDSGYLATQNRSTYSKGEKRGYNKEVKPPQNTALVSFAMFYARMVENGTSKMAAIPFLRPALDQTKRRAGIKAVLIMKKNLK